MCLFSHWRIITNFLRPDAANHDLWIAFWILGWQCRLSNCPRLVFSMPNAPRYIWFIILMVHSCLKPAGNAGKRKQKDAMSIEAKYFIQINTDANRCRTISKHPCTVNRTEASCTAIHRQRVYRFTPTVHTGDSSRVVFDLHVDSLGPHVIYQIKSEEIQCIHALTFACVCVYV